MGRAVSFSLHAPTSPRSRRSRIRRLLVAVAALATLAAVVTAAARAADTHGYPRTFHLWGGWYGAEALARYDMVVGYESNWDLAALRARNPTGVYLLSPGMNPSQVETYGMTHLTYGALDEWRGGTCPAPVGYVPAFDPAVDYLHRPNGSLALVGNQWADPGFNLARAATAAKVAKIFACTALRDGLVTKGWDGVWSDNWIHSIGASWFYGSPLDTNYDGVADDPANLRRRWDNGLALVGSTLRALLPGKTVGGNGIWYGSSGHKGDDPTSWLGEANVTMMEYQNDYYRRPREFVETVSRWLDFADPGGQTRYFAVEQAALRADGSKFTASGDLNSTANMLDPGVMKGMRWGLTLALMTGAYFEVNPDQMHDARWWYDEYDGGIGVRGRGYLGDALAGPTELASGVWRRDFENGIALNNSSDAVASIALEAPFRHLRGSQNPGLNDGSTVTTVLVPPHDGVVLLRTVPSTSPDPGDGDPGGAGDPGGTDGTPDTGGTPTGGRPNRPVANFSGARAPTRARLSVRVRGRQGARLAVVVRGPRGRVLARARGHVGESGLVRYRFRLRHYRHQRRLHVSLGATLGDRRTRARLNLRLSPRGYGIVGSSSSVVAH